MSRRKSSRRKVTKRVDKIRAEVIKAYADQTMSSNKADAIRNLHFKASKAVTVARAKAILSVAIPDGYNEFSADLLDEFPEDVSVVIARENSVALYVSGNNLPSKRAVSASKYSRLDDGSVRYWWD